MYQIIYQYEMTLWDLFVACIYPLSYRKNTFYFPITQLWVQPLPNMPKVTLYLKKDTTTFRILAFSKPLFANVTQALKSAE